MSLRLDWQYHKTPPKKKSERSHWCSHSWFLKPWERIHQDKIWIIASGTPVDISCPLWGVKSWGQWGPLGVIRGLCSWAHFSTHRVIYKYIKNRLSLNWACWESHIGWVSFLLPISCHKMPVLPPDSDSKKKTSGYSFLTLDHTLSPDKPAFFVT